jgi:hypothetical protein
MYLLIQSPYFSKIASSVISSSWVISVISLIFAQEVHRCVKGQADE